MILRAVPQFAVVLCSRLSGPGTGRAYPVVEAARESAAKPAPLPEWAHKNPWHRQPGHTPA